MKERTKREIRRKSIHMIPGILGPVVVLLPAYIFSEIIGRTLGVIISLFFFIIYTLNHLHLKGKIKYEIPIGTSTFRIMARENELESSTFVGPILFWGILVIMFLFLDLEVAMVGVWTSAIGDAFAAIVGTEVGKHKIPYNKRKSFEGSFALFITAFIGNYLILLMDPPMFYNVLILSLIASIAGAILESLPGSYLLDEITVPLIPAVMIQILGGYSFYLLGGLI